MQFSVAGIPNGGWRHYLWSLSNWLVTDGLSVWHRKRNWCRKQWKIIQHQLTLRSIHSWSNGWSRVWARMKLLQTLEEWWSLLLTLWVGIYLLTYVGSWLSHHFSASCCNWMKPTVGAIQVTVHVVKNVTATGNLQWTVNIYWILVDR